MRVEKIWVNCHGIISLKLCSQRVVLFIWIHKCQELNSNKVSFITWKKAIHSCSEASLRLPFYLFFFSNFKNLQFIIAAVPPNHPRATNGWKIRGEGLMMPLFPFHHHLTGITKDQRQVEQIHISCSDNPPHETHNTEFMDISEPKRELDRYLRVQMIILAERRLAMVDLCSRLTVFKLNTETQHSSAAQVIHLSPHGSHGWLLPTAACYIPLEFGSV